MKNDDKIYLDAKGYDNYLKEIEELRNLINLNGKKKSSAYTGAVGDGWHDNFDFEEAKREELIIQRKLRDKVDGLSRIVIVERQNNEELIDIDDYIKINMIFDQEDNEEMIVKLVADTNYDNKNNEISLGSPLGETLYKKEVGTSVYYEVDGNKIEVEIIDKSKSNDFNHGVRKR